MSTQEETQLQKSCKRCALNGNRTRILRSARQSSFQLTTIAQQIPYFLISLILHVLQKQQVLLLSFSWCVALKDNDKWVLFVPLEHGMSPWTSSGRRTRSRGRFSIFFDSFALSRALPQTWNTAIRWRGCWPEIRVPYWFKTFYFLLLQIVIS